MKIRIPLDVWAALWGLVAILALTHPAPAQWQVNNNSIPLGKGAGKVGFGAITGSGGAGAKCLIDTTPPTFANCPVQPATNVTYTATGTGAVARTLTSKLDERRSISDWNVTCDGSTDDASKIQNAVTANYKGWVFINSSTSGCKINTTITITDNITIYGTGISGAADVTSISAGTRIIPANGVTAFTVTTSKAVTFQDLSIAYGSQQSAGTACISIIPSGTTLTDINYLSRISNVSCYFADRAFNMTKAANWKIKDCYIWAANVGIYVSNSIGPDSGDSEIAGCSMTLAQTTGIYGIFQESSGGLRLTNNKINGGQFSYIMSWTNTVGTGTGACNSGDLIVTGGSYENMLTGFVFTRQGSSAACTFENVSINGPQFGGFQTAGTAVQIPSDGVLCGWIKNFSINGGVIDGPSSGTSFFVDFTCGNSVSSVGVVMKSNGGTVGRHRIGAGVTGSPVIGLSAGGGTFAASSIGLTCGVDITCVAPY